VCGIAGYVTTDPRLVDEQDLLAMSHALRHRGPDDDGLMVDEGVGLAHRRLAILDPSPAGHQPMAGPEGTWVTYNGEIYNFQQLAAGLRARGIQTRTRCDTEVLLLMLHRFGLDALSAFNGMFAFGHWDPRSRTMTLVRDRLGVKPLYYYADSRCLVFSSELKALERWRRCPRDIDTQAVDLYLSYEHVPAPWTMLRGVRKLEPGSWLRWSRGRVTSGRWWSLEFTEPATRRSIEDWAQECRHHLLRATRLRLVSDVPLGVLLSGGVDSSAVAAAMAELGAPTRAFSISFRGQRDYDEIGYARQVAARIGATHRVQQLEPRAETCLEVLDNALDEPLGDVSLLPTYLVSTLARSEVAVVLSGDGGDEAFAGYDWYRASQLAGPYQRLPGPVRHAIDRALGLVPPRPEKKGLVNKVKRFAEGAASDPALEHLRWQIFLDQASKRKLYSGALAPLSEQQEATQLGRDMMRRASAEHPLSRRQWVDFGLYLPDDILAKVDRASMAVSLETRGPFLDYELVEFAARMPARLKMGPAGRKLVLRRSIADMVPHQAIARPKQGFSMPMKHWLRNDLVPLARELLLSESSAEWFSRPYCHQLLEEHISGRRNHAHILWNLMVLQWWRCRRDLDSRQRHVPGGAGYGHSLVMAPLESRANAEAESAHCGTLDSRPSEA
jgi:asparagine synthase (glutamine-hydrolysing)